MTAALILSVPALARRLAREKRTGEKGPRRGHRTPVRGGGHRTLVFTNGCFDVLHVGHLKVLEWARRQGDALVVALNTDDSVRRLKGPTRPFVPLKDRARLVAGLKPVDYVTWFDEDTPLQTLKILRPDVLVKGGDWKSGDIVGGDLVKKVVRVPLARGRSTTQLADIIARRSREG